MKRDYSAVGYRLGHHVYIPDWNRDMFYVAMSKLPSGPSESSMELFPLA
jgi:hypothetical protein